MIITLSCLNSDVFALRARYPARGIRHFAVRGAAGVFAFHPANGGYRRSTEAARLKGLGMRPGVPAQVVIPLRKRTALQYLFEPLTQSLWASFRQR